MKRTHAMLGVTLVIGAAAVVAAAEQQQGQQQQKSPATAPAATQPVNKFCAVQQENPVDVAKGGTTVYKGKTIGFCCPDCIDEFKKDPEKYMATIK